MNPHNSNNQSTSLFISLRIILFTGLVTLLCTTLWSQAPNQGPSHDPHHRFVISPQTFFGDSFDLSASSLYRLALGGGGHIHYEYIAPKHYHFVEAEGAIGALLANYSSNGAISLTGTNSGDLDIFLDLVYGSQFSVFSLSRLKLYFGFTIEGHVDFWLISAFLSYGWNATMTIGPSFSVFLPLDLANKHQLRIKYYLPLIGSLSRPRYNTYNFEIERILENSNGLVEVLINTLVYTTDLYSWRDAFRTSLDASYEWHFSSNVGLFTRYALSLDYYKKPISQPKTVVIHRLYIGISIFW